MSDQTIFRNACPAIPYTMISNSCLKDPRLSPEAGWVLVFMLSQKRNFTFNMAFVAKNRRLGRDRCQAAIRELVELGYCRRDRNSKSAGPANSYTYLFTDVSGTFADPEPEDQFSEGSKPEDQFPGLQEPEDQAPYKEKTLEKKNTEKEEPPTPSARGLALEAYQLWNDMALRVGLQQATKLTPDRDRKLRARLEDFGLDGWKRALNNVERSKFLRGLEGERRWRASFDFLISPAGFAKVHDGNYEGAPKWGVRPVASAAPLPPPKPAIEVQVFRKGTPEYEAELAAARADDQARADAIEIKGWVKTYPMARAS